MKNVIKVTILCVISVYLSACGGTTGWQFSIGVHPITAIDNHQTLQNKAGAIIPQDDKRRY